MIQKDKISVIIPVHNGEKYLKKLYKCINSQTYKNIEIIFVENFSIDNSLGVLNNIAQKDERVVVLESKEKGTSLARKKGVEYATGKYIVFMDQDDKYVNKFALEKMHKTISETESNICQFSTYTYYGFGIKRIKKATDKLIFFSKLDIRNKEIGSIFESYGGGYITPSVWSKIYDTRVVKDAIGNVNFALFFAEDYYLNSCCFLSDKLKKVCVSPDAYYVWDKRFGFSSSKSAGFAWIKDCSIIKPIICKKLKEADAGYETKYRFHLESLYAMFAYIKSESKNKDKEKIIKLIEWFNSLEYIKLAKDFMNNEVKDKNKWEELVFLSSDYTPEEYYSRFFG